MRSLDEQDLFREKLQRELNSLRTLPERNKLGQHATPLGLALEILHYARLLTSDLPQIRFLDPAFGIGTFYHALLSEFPRDRIHSAIGFEIDRSFVQAAEELWSGFPIDIRLADFTAIEPNFESSELPNLIICNPPYVRHHHLDRLTKERLQNEAMVRTRIVPNGLSGLYVYFILLAHSWMSKGAISGWLIPSEFMDVGYGRYLRTYLLDRVTLLRIHRFRPEDVQFGDATVSSSIIWFKNEPPPSNHIVKFSYGGSLLNPESIKSVEASLLKRETKWIKFFDESQFIPPKFTLDHLFMIKRGIATGANSFFIMTSERAEELGLASEFLFPILPSPRGLDADVVYADEHGMPLLDPQYVLLSCDLPEERIQVEYPELWSYLEEGIRQGVHKRYLCRNRNPWYSQELRQPAPLLCSYMGRSTDKTSSPFRFILNLSSAIVTNTYLMMYPNQNLHLLITKNPKLLLDIWSALRAIPSNLLIREGRVYGGGLHKIEPKELGRVPADTLFDTVLDLSKTLVFQTQLE
ncbi:MAG: Eco57I restriction-modification methylase domain-containing protein [Candidatus Thorarchaeota archaeon]|nr:Eco57I restriction-modification methylase domain-containing protein [Candidatus Thorarchaeota archaeon]